jgi:hypothetical protein
MHGTAGEPQDVLATLPAPEVPAVLTANVHVPCGGSWHMAAFIPPSASDVQSFTSHGSADPARLPSAKLNERGVYGDSAGTPGVFR